MNDEKRNPDTYNANGNEKWMLYQFLVVPDRESSKGESSSFRIQRKRASERETSLWVFFFGVKFTHP